MVQIYPIAPPFDKLLGAQPDDCNASWRPMAYTLQIPTEDGLLLYNTLIKSMVLLEPKEAEALSATGTPSVELIENWLYVPEAFDDKTLANQVFDISRELLPANPNITSYTVFTTTDCNARCFYCYEKGIAKKRMNAQTAHSVASYMMHHAGGKKLKIQWFGGEPLYNKAVISIICEDLKAAGVSFVSGMISNAYLFDEATAKEARDDWNMTGIQITLDGTEEVYNRAKSYIYPGVNAYRRVMDNIRILLGTGIQVKIRLNVDSYNADNLIALTEELCQEFKGESGLCIYSHPLMGRICEMLPYITMKNASCFTRKKPRCKRLLIRPDSRIRDHFNI